MIERDDERRFCDYAMRHGCLCMKMRNDGSNGLPDRQVVTPLGHVCYFEFKTPRGVLSRQQKYWIRELESRKLRVYVVRSYDQAKDILQRMLKDENDIR